jgi:2-amino-4-hydroxy-6-hydroxymethyldihydropteridine diphosphokinase
MPPAPLVLVALGANLGQPAVQIREAFQRLAALSATPVRQSSLWNTSPMDCPPDSPSFVNAAAVLTPHPGATPEAWLAELQALEREFGRRPKVILNEARPLDLDLIAWEGITRDTPQLILPHPRATLRRFVLAPLAEIAPEFCLVPGGPTVRQLLDRLPDAGDVRRL